jgi:DivIVA domain-containing protein
MADPHTSEPMTPRFRRGRSASELLEDAAFPLAMRGYDRRAVDEFLDELRALVAQLEARQTREGVVQKALDELGEETAGILQRAHETADEITARSRAKADGRLQRAEREADIVRREADQYAEQVVVDTRLLWEERQRLIDDVRQLADEVLGTADDALERLKLPEPLALREAMEDTTIAEEPGPVGPAGPAPVPDEPQADPDATQAYEVEAPGELAAPHADEPAPEDEQGDEPESSHTVELEALPGGGGDEQTGEPERE